MFSKPEPVVQLLKHYDFDLTEVSSGCLELKGSFLKLKLVRNELIRLRGHERLPHVRAPSALHNGSTTGYNMERESLDPRFVSKSISRNVDQMGAVSWDQLLDSAPSSSSSYRDTASGGFPRSFQSSHSSYTERNASSLVGAVRRQDSSELLAHRRSPLVDGASSLSANSPSSLMPLPHTSPLFRDSASDESPRSLVSSYYSLDGNPTMDTMQNHTSYRDSASGRSHRWRPSFNSDTSHSSPSSSTGGKTSFTVDRDIINFILTQRQGDVKEIEKLYSTRFGVQDNAEVTVVTFWGKDSEKAKAHFLDIIKELNFLLRIQEIQLKEYDNAKQKQILERIQPNEDSGVMITLNDDVVKLVGFSKESFEMKQKILGHSHDPQRGRPLGGSSKSRRSTSVPRHHKVTDHVGVTDHDNQTSVASNYSPSRYQMKSDEVEAPQIVQSHEQASVENSRWTRSSSESREKYRTSREQPMRPDVESSSSSQEKKKPKQKGTDLQKLRDLDPKGNAIIRALQIKKKKDTPKN